jgi:hypothetical protein
VIGLPREWGDSMNLYAMVGAGNGSLEATALRTRLAAWHDAMVAHERKIRAGRTRTACDEECPHGEARMLWSEAVATFGDRARELTFLRTRALGSAHVSARSRPATVEV